MRKAKKRVEPRRRPARRPARQRRVLATAEGKGPERSGSYRRLQFDLVHEAYARSGSVVLHRLEALFREREVVEVEGLIRLTVSALRALASLGFHRVDHWEVRPGGWLPLPEPTHTALAEPVNHLLTALESPEWARVADARSFAVRLSGSGRTRIDLVVRRVHRETSHAITVEVRGASSSGELRRIESALRSNLVVARVRRFDSPRRIPFGIVRGRARRPEAS